MGRSEFRSTLLHGSFCAAAMLAQFALSIGFLAPRFHVSKTYLHAPAGSRPTPTGTSAISRNDLRSGALLAAGVALAARSRTSHINAKVKKSQSSVRLSATGEAPLVVKTEDEAEVNWSKVSNEWEIDCFSRPVLREGKKMWELMVTDSNAVYRRVAQMKPTRVNSVVVQKLLTIFIEEAKVKPKVIRFYRKVMKNMLSVAAYAVKDGSEELEDLEIVPSRNCHMLRLWLTYREREVYPRMAGYQAPKKRKPTNVTAELVKLAYERLPNKLIVESWSLSTAPFGELRRAKSGELPGDLCRLPPGVPDKDPVAGVVFLTRRDEIIAALLDGKEITSVRFDPDNNEFLLDVGIDTTYLIGKIPAENRDGYLQFERRKKELGGLHFFAVQNLQKSRVAETQKLSEVTALWTLMDYTMQDEVTDMN